MRGHPRLAYNALRATSRETMYRTEWLPYLGPNRRSEGTVIEISAFASGTGSPPELPAAGATRGLLREAGILAGEERFPDPEPSGGPLARYVMLMAQTALLLQRKAGHRVGLCEAGPCDETRRCIAWVEHQHQDVGLTAVKLAFELVNGRLRDPAEPFGRFREFAEARRLPRDTEAIMEAARRLDIPCVHLERPPYSRQRFEDVTAGTCLRPGGLVMLGHGSQRKILDGLFGDPAAARMPIIAVTGTNGKTTTCRMIAHVLKEAGRKPGLVCTDGIYLDGRELQTGDRSTRGGHLEVLTSEAVDFAVLETHHGGIIAQGFAFHRCDIAVCLNVTEDHLGHAHVESVEEMAEIKQALIERARHAAVLNADDRHCRAMAQAASADRTCLVSESAEVPVEADCTCTVESIDGTPWAVIHVSGRRLPVMAVRDVPATFGGTAGFNVSNALHAVAACHLAGIPAQTIRSALSGFRAGPERTPARLNLYDELPFRVVVDFAHNPDGVRRVTEFATRQETRGRRIISFAGAPNRADQTLANLARAAAGHYAHYFCRNYPDPPGKTRRGTAHILKSALLEAGVPPERITVQDRGKSVIMELFEYCRAGDLLVLLVGHIERHLVEAYIQEHAQRLANHGARRADEPRT